MLRIKKNDQVKVIAGKDKGKTGRVIDVLPEVQRVVVENINLAKKSQRKTQQNPQGGYIELEKPVALANLMLVEKKGNTPVVW